MTDARRREETGETMVAGSVLDEVIRRVVEVAKPEKIILFGSAARGQLSPHSDLDLLVIAETENPLAVAGEIYANLRGVGVPVDALVATPGQIERHRDTNGLVFKPALDEGIVVYDATMAATPASQRIAERSVGETGPDPAILDDIVGRIVDVAKPDKIILFGPAARGHLPPGRDIPLLIVAQARNPGELVGRIYTHLYGVGAGVAAIVATPERMERYRHEDGFVFKHAIDEGIVLYDAA